jgi:O-antigen/teichoic acid export membrane protein
MSAVKLLGRVPGLLVRAEKMPSMRKFGRLFTLADQGALSLANFVLSISLIRLYSKEEFAAYSMGLFTALLVSGAYRVGVAIPVSLWGPAMFERRKAAVASLHLAVLAGIVLIAAVSLGAVVMFSKGTFWLHIAIALFGLMPLYASLDIDRVMVMRRYGVIASCMVSGLLSVALISLSITVIILRPRFEFALAGLAAIAITKSIILNNLEEHGRLHRSMAIWRVMLRTSMTWGVGGNLVSSIYMTLPQWILGLHAPPAQVAGFAAVRTPLQPVMILLRGFDAFDKVAFGRIDRSNTRGISSHATRTVMLYLAASTAFAVLISCFAGQVIHLILGAQYAEFANTLRLTAVAFAVTATAAPLETIVFGENQNKAYALHQFAGACITVVLVYPLILFFKANGAVVASMVGWIPPYFMLIKAFRRAQIADKT